MDSNELKWATEKRFQFMEYQAFWRGSLNRADLTSHFGISIPQASKDLSSYQTLFPQNIRYDHSRKRYFTTSVFKPGFISLDANEFLLGLSSSSDDQLQTSDIETDSVPIPIRNVDPFVLQAIVACILNDRSIEVLYQSMSINRPDPKWRRITPHGFASDGLRWHTRAYCHNDNKFKDFILSRSIETRNQSDPGSSAEKDVFWNEFFDVVLVPNPALSQSQQRIIEADFAMVNGSMQIPVRKAMLYYFEKRLRLDVAHLVDEPGECPIVISNRKEFDDALREATR